MCDHAEDSRMHVADTAPEMHATNQENAEENAAGAQARPQPQLQRPQSPVGVYANEFRNMRLSTCWKTRPKLWFIHLECEFSSYGIRSDRVKFNAVIRHVDEQPMFTVADILEVPQADGMYERLKAALIERFSISQEKQLRTLLSDLELGEQTPSALLRRMKDLAGANVSESMLRTLWLQRLPQKIQEVLVVLEEVELQKLATLADKAV